MSVNYKIFIQCPSSPELLSSVCKALRISEVDDVSVSENIMTLSYINSKRYSSLQQLFPIKSAIFSDEEYEEYIFSEEEKELISLFLKDSPFIIYGHDCDDFLTLCTTEQKYEFSDSDIKFWNTMNQGCQKSILENFQKAYKIEPDNIFVLFEYANYFYLMSEFENAKKYYLKLLKKPLIIKDAVFCLYTSGKSSSFNIIKNLEFNLSACLNCPFKPRDVYSVSTLKPFPLKY